MPDAILCILFYTSQNEEPTLFPSPAISAGTSSLLFAMRSVICVVFSLGNKAGLNWVSQLLLWAPPLTTATPCAVTVVAQRRVVFTFCVWYSYCCESEQSKLSPWLCVMEVKQFGCSLEWPWLGSLLLEYLFLVKGAWSAWSWSEAFPKLSRSVSNWS